MSQVEQQEQQYNFDGVNWSRVLEPTPEMKTERVIRNDVSEDLFTMTEAVRGGKKPEEIWEGLNLSRATGLPFSTVEEDRDTALTLSYKKALRGEVDALRTFLDTSPNMLEFVTTRPAAEGAAMSTDKPLWKLESVQRGFLADTSHAYTMGKLSQERMALLYRDFRGVATDAERERITFLGDRLALDAREREGESTADWIRRNSVELLPQLRDMGANVFQRSAQGTAVGATAGAAYGAVGGSVLGSVVPGAGTLAGGGAGAITGGVAGGVAGLTGGAAFGGLEYSYSQSVSEIWDTIRDMKDDHGNAIDTDTARAIAALGALPMAGLDMFSMGKALEVVPGLDRFLGKAAVEKVATFLRNNPGILGAFKEATMRSLTALATEVGTEALQEGAVIAAEEVAKNTGHLDIAPITAGEAVSRMAGAGKEAFAAVLPLAVGGGAGRTFVNRRRQATQANMQTLDNLHTLITESETMHHAPDLAAEYVQRIGENGGVGEIYIRPEAVQRVFFQSQEGIAQASAMGITPETVAEALALDMDIAVPMNTAATHIFADERHYSALREDIRLNPEIETARESADRSVQDEDTETQTHAFIDFLEEMEAGLAVEMEANARRSAMAEPYITQLVNARYTQRQAEHLTAPFVAHAEVMAPMFNQTPEEYLSQRLAGFELTTPDAMALTAEDLDALARKNLASAPLKERNPMLAAIWGRVSPADIKRYDPQGYKDLNKKYGRGLFRGKEKNGGGKEKNGVGLDRFADELVRDGLLPEGSGANELLAALQDSDRTFYQAAMYRSRAASIDEFVQEVDSGPKWKEKAFFDFGGSVINREDGLLTGYKVYLGEDQVRHITSGHPDFADWARIPEVIERGEMYTLDKNQVTGQGTNAFILAEGDSALVVLGSPVDAKKSGKRVTVLTAFTSTPTGAQNWIESKQKNAASSQSAGGSPAYPSSQGNVPFGSENGASTQEINAPDANVNEGDFPKGKTYFSGDAEGARGAISLTDSGAVISLFRGRKNLSTVLHEGGHFFLENLAEAAQLTAAPEWVKESWHGVQQEFGFEGFTIPEAAHEGFARAFEAYTREGKAPSVRLDSAFRQFRNWLSILYRSVRGLIAGEGISPEVRLTFDRLLATGEEITQARQAGSTVDTLGNLEREGVTLSPELRTRYAEAVNKAQARAESVIAARRLVEQRKAEKAFRAQAREMVENTPFYHAENSVREAGGIRWESVLEFVDEDLAWTLRNKWSADFAKGFIKEDGALDFADTAARFDQDAPLNFAGLLLATPTRAEAIQVEMDMALAEWNRTFDGSMEFSAAMDEALAVELEALTGEKQLSGARFRAELDRRTGVKKSALVDAEYKALKASLRKQNNILSEVMRDVRRDIREKNTGWREKLALVRQDERAKRAALAAAYRARIERDKLTRQIRRDATSKTVNDEFRQQILSIVGHWRRLGTESMAARDLDNMPTLAEFLTQHESFFDEEESLFPEWILQEDRTAGTKSAGDLSLEDVRDLARSVKILAHKGRNYDRLLSFGEQVAVTEAAGECIASMNQAAGTAFLSEQDRATVTGKFRGLLRGLTADITALRYVFDAMDGYVNIGGKNADTGPNHKYIVAGLQNAMSRERALLREYDAKLAAQFAMLYRNDAGKGFVIDGVSLPADVAREWGGVFTHEKVVAVALNMGNTGNMRALMRGYGWSEADLQRIVSHLTVDELHAVQSIRDTINELHPVLNETYQRLHGVPLSKVEAMPLTLQAADGETTLPGGYYPLVFDHALSRKAEEMRNVDELINRNENVLRSAKPKSGMTKERTGGTLPPRLSLSVARQHVIDTIHYATHAAALRDVNRITALPEYREAFARAAGLETYNELQPWLRHIARPEGAYIGKFSRAMEWLARRGSLYALGLNMKSAFLQLSSLGNSIKEVGGQGFARGMAQMITRPHEAYTAVRGKSAYMESRARQLDATLKEQLDRFSPERANGVVFVGRWFSLEQVQNAQFALIQGLDAAVAYPTWIAAHDAAIAAGIDGQEAVRTADEAVIRAQGSGGSMDVPKILRERGFVKLSTSFMSFALNDLNRKMYYTGGFREHLRGGRSDVDFKTFAQHFALEWAAPVIFSTLMLSLGRDGELPDAEDFTWETVGFLTMGIPVVRDVARVAETSFSGKGYGARMGGSVGYAGFESGVKAMKQGAKWVNEGGDTARDKFIRELINTMGFVSGIGTPQLWRTLGGSKAFFVDSEGGVLAPFLGKPKKDR